MTQTIDGKLLSEKIRAELATEIKNIKKNKKKVPGLAVVLVGQDPASQVYVKNKILACEKTGIQSFHHFLPEKTSEKQLLKLIEVLNQDPAVNGILVQLPLPKQIQSEKIIRAIDPKKDVDGLHPLTLGLLASGQKTFVPCTPAGIIRMLDEIGFDPAGKEAVVVGRSNIVGKPIALLLLEKNATVTICHSRTENLEAKVKKGDLVIASVGSPELIKGSWIKPGAVVIDVGINRMKDGKLIGDVEFSKAVKRASAITPVPGGVGPMTITMLLKNCVEAFRRENSKKQKN